MLRNEDSAEERKTAECPHEARYKSNSHKSLCLKAHFNSNIRDVYSLLLIKVLYSSAFLLTHTALWVSF